MPEGVDKGACPQCDGDLHWACSNDGTCEEEWCELCGYWHERYYESYEDDCPECGSVRYNKVQLDDGIECECWDCGFYKFEFDEECDEELANGRE